MKRVCTLLVVAGLALVTPPVDASTLRRIEPTAGATLIAYQLTIGSTMKRDGEAKELFGDDRRRADAFEARAVETIVRRLRERGIGSEADSLETKAAAHFLAAFYGHRIEAADCAGAFVYYLSARGMRRADGGESEETWEWTALNSAPAGSLEEALLKDLELALADYLLERPVTSTGPPATPPHRHPAR
jgi:hypothetical protein